jgi:hypothetical protein
VPQLVACPSCGRLLEAVGILTMAEANLDEVPPQTVRLVGHPVYQCPACTVVEVAFGMKAEVALTFLADGAGRAVDPRTMIPIRTLPVPGVN